MTNPPVATQGSCHREIPPTRGGTSRQAAAALELAIVLPLLTLLVLAAVDFGRIVHAYIVVSHAARAGAGYAATHRFTTFTRTTWETQVKQAVQGEMQGLSEFNSGSLQVSIQTTTESSDRLRVGIDVTYPYSTIVEWIGIPATVQLKRHLEVRQHR